MKEPEKILKKFGFEDDALLREALLAMESLQKPTTTKEEAWSRFEQSVQNKKVSVPLSMKNSYGLLLKIAASVLILISVGIGFKFWNTVDYTTTNNQIRKIVLPDNSIVTLNAATSLAYHKLGWLNSRKVTLSGEALFSITKGKTFEIATLGNTVTVLGTEFNVFSRKEYFEVQCHSGKVAVKTPGNPQLFLTKDEGVKKDNSQQSLLKFKVDHEAYSWVKGSFYYQDADLNRVLDELSRQFNVKIIHPEATRRYTGFFNKRDLTEALNNICLPMGLKYTVSKDTVVVR